MVNHILRIPVLQELLFRDALIPLPVAQSLLQLPHMMENPHSPTLARRALSIRS